MEHHSRRSTLSTPAHLGMCRISSFIHNSRTGGGNFLPAPVYESQLFENVFLQFAECICTICQMYLSKLQNVFVGIAKYICSNWWQLLTCCSPAYTVSSESQLAIAKYIYLNCKMYFSKLQNIYVLIAKCISLYCKMYLSKLQNVFV